VCHVGVAAMAMNNGMLLAVVLGCVCVWEVWNDEDMDCEQWDNWSSVKVMGDWQFVGRDQLRQIKVFTIATTHPLFG
jgi:hypothetical protein